MTKHLWWLWLIGCNPSKDQTEGPTCIEEDTVGDGQDSNCDGIDGIDEDQDGFASISSGGLDCDDQDALIHPDAIEICDEIDNNCDSLIDDQDETLDLSTASTWFADSDEDGFGSSDTVQTCVMPQGYTDNQDDCDDQNTETNPDATEVCDEIDNNCDSLIDDQDENLDITTAQVWYLDTDEDGFGSTDTTQTCVMPTGYTDNQDDCDDQNTAINPDATEVCDEIDNNCDSLIDDQDETLDINTTTNWFLDSDGDGFGSTNTIQTCVIPQGYVTNQDDCDDQDVLIHPDAIEVCDEIDNNCDSLIDDQDETLDMNTTTNWYLDTDEDGFGSTETIQTCVMPTGYTDNQDDCDDQNTAINPDATEVCDEIDNNCDSLIDDQDLGLDIFSATTWFLDDDSDGQGTPDDSTVACLQPNKYVDNSQDCDDSDPLTFFGNAFMESQLDCYQDLDQDGYGESNPSNIHVAAGEDCDDNDDTINPNAVDIPADGIDQDCDGSDSLPVMSDFSLPDINPQSATYGQTISVRDQLQKVSGWYFIKAT